MTVYGCSLTWISVLQVNIQIAPRMWSGLSCQVSLNPFWAKIKELYPHLPKKLFPKTLVRGFLGILIRCEKLAAMWLSITKNLSRWTQMKCYISGILLVTIHTTDIFIFIICAINDLPLIFIALWNNGPELISNLLFFRSHVILPQLQAIQLANLALPHSPVVDTEKTGMTHWDIRCKWTIAASMVLHFDKNNVCCEKVYYSEALLSPSLLYNMIEGSDFLSFVTILSWLFRC